MDIDGIDPEATPVISEPDAEVTRMSIPARYEIWQHTSGEFYAIRFVDQSGIINGVCGPVKPRNTPYLSEYNYQHEDVEWVIDHMTQFTLWESDNRAFLPHEVSNG